MVKNKLPCPSMHAGVGRYRSDDVDKEIERVFNILNNLPFTGALRAMYHING